MPYPGMKPLFSPAVVKALLLPLHCICGLFCPYPRPPVLPALSVQNRYLEANDRPERVDLRSYARQGLDIVPTVHEGAAVRQMEKRGIQTNIGNLNREIRAANSLMKSIRQLYNVLSGSDGQNYT